MMVNRASYVTGRSLGAPHPSFSVPANGLKETKMTHLAVVDLLSCFVADAQDVAMDGSSSVSHQGTHDHRMQHSL
jgi:hypothetical protein